MGSIHSGIPREGHHDFLRALRRCSLQRMFRSHLCSPGSWQSRAHFRLDRECPSREFPRFDRSEVVGRPHRARKAPHTADPRRSPKKGVCHSSALGRIRLQMKPDTIPSEAEIAWVRLGRVGWVDRHFLKSQDSAVIVFGSGSIRDRNDRNGAVL